MAVPNGMTHVRHLKECLAYRNAYMLLLLFSNIFTLDVGLSLLGSGELGRSRCEWLRL